MKKILLSVVLATTLALTSCQFDDSDIWGKLDEYGQSIKDHENRISALEELCKQMNTNISSLQAIIEALQNNDYVTSVIPVYKDGVVIGYTITFAKSQPITIYHGEDGKDGQDGANGQDGKDGKDGNDGYTPQIGVAKDTDGIYYWTIDGKWLLDANGNKVKAVGTDGKDGQNGEDGKDGADGEDGKDGADGEDGKDGQDGTNGSNGQDGVNGTNGKDGQDGKDGKDGITPRLKIENDYWYVSYDNGATWEKLGKATGDDGIDGENGEDGDSIFKSVTQDDEYVYFNLADGTMITLPKHDKENIQFEDLQVKAICCKNWDTNNDGELSYAEAAAVTDIGDVFSENDKIIAFSEFKYFEGIVSLSNKAFYNCVNLWKIELPQYLTKFEEGTVNGGATNGFRGYGSFSGTSIANIVLPKVIKSIGNGAFAYCDELKSVKIPNGVSSIESHAFRDCTSLTSVLIPDSVTAIGNSAFSGCASLTSIAIPDSATSIGKYTFSSCSNLATIEIGNGIVAIPEGFSMSCSLLTTVIIGENVKEIHYGAFSACNRLTDIYCKPIAPPQIYYSRYGGLSFTNVAGMKIYVPRDSYKNYTSYSTTRDQIIAQENWSLYKSYIQPYDFE